MSAAGIMATKQQQKSYFELHADSRTIVIEGSESTFPAFFTYASLNGERDGGNVVQHKHAPHLTFFSDFVVLLEPRVTKVIVPLTYNVDGTVATTETFTVHEIGDDLTAETFQAEARLL